MPSPIAKRVVKIGGSLLNLPDLTERLLRWQKHQINACNFFLVGGGWIVDGLRIWCQSHPTAEEILHFRAIECMDINTSVLSQQLGWPIANATKISIESLETNCNSFVSVLDWARNNRELPRTWQVTSDSIAAALAKGLGANELVLLKSRLPEKHELEASNDSEYVDEYFWNCIENIPALRFVDLSQEPAMEQAVGSSAFPRAILQSESGKQLLNTGIRSKCTL